MVNEVEGAADATCTLVLMLQGKDVDRHLLGLSLVMKKGERISRRVSFVGGVKAPEITTCQCRGHKGE